MKAAANCRNAIVPFFFKQHGGVNKKKSGRSLEGRTWDEMPRVSQKRQRCTRTPTRDA